MVIHGYVNLKKIMSITIDHMQHAYIPLHITTTTVQVAKCACVHVCTLVNAWLVKEIPPPVQVAGGRWQHRCKSSVHISKCVLVGTRKTPPVQVAEGQDHLGH